jgi:hypothetical protein
MFSSDFPSIPNAIALLNSLSEASFKAGQPSDDVLALLEWIESADPNSPDYSKDDINSNWGHHQFTAGNMRITSILTSWDQIGVKMAVGSLRLPSRHAM